MSLYKVIFINLILIKFINADLVVCENNECRRAGLIKMDSFLNDLDTIKEGHQKMAKLLMELTETFDRKSTIMSIELEKIKYEIHERVNQLQASNEEYTNNKVVDSSLYNNLWIVVQTRQDGSEDFYRNWTDYKNGFGSEVGEFFVGLDKIYELTNDRDHEMLVIITDFQGNAKYAHYDNFLIGDESERYRLKKLGEYKGTAGNHMKFHLNRFFTTKDRDNDDADEGNCAHWFKGAWWYYNCMTSNLNGPYRYNGTLNANERGVGVTWGSYDQIKFSYKATQMLIRAKA